MINQQQIQEIKEKKKQLDEKKQQIERKLSQLEGEKEGYIKAIKEKGFNNSQEVKQRLQDIDTECVKITKEVETALQKVETQLQNIKTNE